MLPSDIIYFSFEALKSRKLRSFLTTIMVVVGVGLLIALNGMGAGMLFYMEHEFTKLGNNVLLLMAHTTIPMFSNSGGKAISLDKNTLIRLHGIPHVIAIIPYYTGQVQIVSGSYSTYVMAIGISRSKLKLMIPSMRLEEGIYPVDYDHIGVLIGYYVAKPPGKSYREIDLNQVITVYSRNNKKTLVVKGIISYIGANPFVQVDNSIFISPEVANNIFEKNGKYDGVYIVTEKPEYNKYVIKEIKRRMGEDIMIFSSETITEVVGNIMTAVNIFLGGIGIVSLIVASIGIMATMYTSVLERTREIGILKSIGFKDKDVLILFLNEAFLIGIIGSSGGVILGFLIGYFGLTSPFRGSILEVIWGFEPVYYPENVISIWLFSIIISIVSGMYPAYKASKMDPVVSLKHIE
ncbi:MAG TPA: ABC transporter permease [Thermoprotei archaeon]|nr:MAG: hypothetical protein DRJ34_01045 [Thermoprotei archaeon]HDJ89706.1 ABC transporter permease [Thermoprotei archaeon]